MKIIGITGASGAGKSTIVKLFGLKTVDADKAARKATEKGSQCLKILSEKFGNDIIFPDGSLDRKKLATKAFASQEKTELLNSITHPFIIEIMNNEIELHRKNKEKAIILDAPQLFEAGCEKMCDCVIGVIADKEIRKIRIMNRDNINEKQAETRLKAGKPDEFFLSKCEYIIINNDEIDKLKKDVKTILEDIGIR